MSQPTAPAEAGTESFEQLFGALSTAFVERAAGDIDSILERSLRKVVEFFDFDRSTLAEFRSQPEKDGEEELWVTHSWARPGLEAVAAQSLDRLHPALGARLRRGESAGFSSLDDLPPRVRAGVAASGMRSNLTLPLAVGGDVVAALAFGCFRAERRWQEPLVGRLRLVADLFASVLVRRRHDAEIRRLTARLEAENVYLREEIADTHGFNEILGDAPALRGALYKVEQVAPTAAPVLILGETGTGKELFARAVHEHSPRRDRPLVKINCAALPATLIESELFGHVKGAFTGATGAKAGRFELADGGTLFLDEIGEMEMDLQAKLLRVLQEGEFEPVGSGQTRRVDVRVIAATNRDFEQAMQEGRFRSDLYYRLSVFPIELPALRERPSDVPTLVRFFVDRGNKRLGRRVRHVPSAAMAALEAHGWPGNVRELQNVIDRALILSPGDTLEVDASFFQIVKPTAAPALSPGGPGPAVPSPSVPTSAPPSRAADGSLRALADVDREHITAVLEAVHWKINGPGHAAEILGLHPSTLRHRMKKLGIVKPWLRGSDTGT
ncbi:MAG: sigma 54-interacting transcriptional regulator [Acidobacteriota bacterium]